MVDAPEKIWTLGGYAPGNYACRCLDCGEQFVGDKRAITCLDCAVAAAKSQIAELRAELATVKLARDANHNLAVANGERAREEYNRAEAAEARVARLSEAATILLSEIDASSDINAIVGASNPLRAALSGSSAGGWKLVPVEPTAEMLNHPGVDAGERTMRKAWAAMLSAAPAAPTGEAS